MEIMQTVMALFFIMGMREAHPPGHNHSRTKTFSARMMDTAEDSFGPSNLLHKSRSSCAPHFPRFPHLPGPSVHQQIIAGYSGKCG